MRGEKVDETLISHCGREIDLVDKAGERRFCCEGRDDRLTVAASKASDAQIRRRIDKRKPRHSRGEAPSRAKPRRATSKAPNLVSISPGCSARVTARPVSAARLARST
jgi:hypothetical protein